MKKEVFKIPHLWIKDDIFNYMALSDELYEEELDEVRALIDAAEEVARPKAILCDCAITARGEDYVELDGVRFDSAFVAEKLRDCDNAYPYVCTCGTELAAWAAELDDALLGYYADRAMLFYVNAAGQYLSGELSRRNDTGLSLTHLNPGSLALWPLSQQEPLFRLIGTAREDIGVSLKESFLMLPEKSTSGIYFFGQGHFENCQLCDRMNCPGRRKGSEV